MRFQCGYAPQCMVTYLGVQVDTFMLILLALWLQSRNFQPHKGGHRARGPPGDLHGNAIGVKVTPL